jgi:hypothetical protein
MSFHSHFLRRRACGKTTSRDLNLESDSQNKSASICDKFHNSVAEYRVI